MTEKVSGIVEKVNEQNSPADAVRKWTKKAFNINGEWYSAFVTKENAVKLNSVNEGDVVDVTFNVKGNFKNLNNIEVVARNESPGGGLASEKHSPNQAAKPYNVHDREYRITYLASRKDAIEFVKVAIELGLVTLGSKKAEKLDIFEDLVNEYASKFAEAAYVPREDRAIPSVENNNKELIDVE